MTPQGRRFSGKYGSPLRDSLILQAFFLFVSWLALDHGTMFRYSLFALAPTWCIILLIVLRRPAEPTALDLKLVRLSYLALWITLPLFSSLVGPLVD
jgi:hypothetical protein